MDTFWSARLAKAKLQVVAYEDAIDALTVKGMKSYRLLTGQTDISVTPLDLQGLQTQLDRLLNRVATLEKRLGICRGASHIAPNS